MAPTMTVTVTINDGVVVSEYTTELPPIQSQELRLLLAVTYQNRHKLEHLMGLAEVFSRLCSLGLDAFLKEYGTRRLKAVTEELRNLTG